MGLLRLLFWVALIVAALWLWRRVTRKPAAGNAQQRTVKMVRCAQCGVHLPQGQALKEQDRWYCSRSHLEQDKKPGGN
jgi:uncharacterized protein